MPFVGLLVGSILYGTSLAMYALDFDRGVVNAAVWLIYIVVTGGLHIDGLADTFDGIYSNRDRERVLEIMKDSHIGAFGVLGIMLVLGFGVLSSFYLEPIAYLLFPVVGRSMSLIVCGTSSYARKEGMGKVFVERCGKLEIAIGLASMILLSWILYGVVGVYGVFFSTLFSMAMAKKISKAIGGITGDTIGFTIELSQTLFLFGLYSAVKIMAVLN